MTRRSFTVIDIVEILVHWTPVGRRPRWQGASGWTGAPSPSTPPRRSPRAMCPAANSCAVQRWAELAHGWFPKLVDPRQRSLTHATIDAHRSEIDQMLKTNTATTVHQRLRDEHGLKVGISSFRRYIWRELPEENLRNIATPPRPEVPAGEEGQVDYGYLGTWFDPLAERARRVWAFVIVLACSRYMFVRPVLSMDQRAWTACHVEAFRFFGGAPRRLVSDNLKTGVIKPDIYDPLLNRSYAELAAHYNCLVDPARALKPKDKPRVERQMPYVRDSMWAGRDWADLASMQRGALVWCTDVAGVRPHRSLEGASPASVFAAIEAPALVALRKFALRAGRLEPPQDRARLLRKGRQGHLHRPVALHRRPPRRPRRATAPSSSTATARWSRPGHASSGASRPTGPTSRPRRWRFSCTRRSGA